MKVAPLAAEAQCWADKGWVRVELAESAYWSMPPRSAAALASCLPIVFAHCCPAAGRLLGRFRRRHSDAALVVVHGAARPACWHDAPVLWRSSSCAFAYLFRVARLGRYKTALWARPSAVREHRDDALRSSCLVARVNRERRTDCRLRPSSWRAGAAQQGLAADKGRLVLGHTLLSAVGKAGFGCDALVKGGPLQLKPSVGRTGDRGGGRAARLPGARGPVVVTPDPNGDHRLTGSRWLRGWTVRSQQAAVLLHDGSLEQSTPRAASWLAERTASASRCHAWCWPVGPGKSCSVRQPHGTAAMCTARRSPSPRYCAGMSIGTKPRRPRAASNKGLQA